MNAAIPRNPKLKTYVGLAFQEGNYSTNRNTIVFVCEATTSSVLWESKKPSIPLPNILLMPPKIVICGGNTAPIPDHDTTISAPEGFQKVNREGKTEQHPWFLRLRLPWV